MTAKYISYYNVVTNILCYLSHLQTPFDFDFEICSAVMKIVGLNEEKKRYSENSVIFYQVS